MDSSNNYMTENVVMDDHCLHHAPVNAVPFLFDRLKFDCLSGNHQNVTS